jgi:transcriptional regulator with XRE-family HTH domain
MGRRKVKYQWDAEAIRALRKHMGLTQQQMSEELGTRQQTISEWETGMYCPRGGMNRLLTLVAERAGFDYRFLVEAPLSPKEAEEFLPEEEEEVLPEEEEEALPEEEEESLLAGEEEETEEPEP